ncbi:NUDIX domain-containing protein [Candidatus Woesearchaeota archaeon]|nr:NUDIX domain-containing protein [Candidatus Woesearchaeota archaeon]
MDHEFLTVVDANDVVLGYSTKDDIKKRGLNYRCIQVFLFNGNDELLICKRPDTKKRYAGQWASVMGHVRRGESYEEAAHREVMEEIGIKTKLKRITKFSNVDGAGRVFQEIFSGGAPEKIKPDKTEISEAKFVNMKDLRTEMVMGSAKYAQPFVEAVRAYMKAKNIF